MPLGDQDFTSDPVWQMANYTAVDYFPMRTELMQVMESLIHITVELPIFAFRWGSFTAHAAESQVLAVPCTISPIMFCERTVLSDFKRRRIGRKTSGRLRPASIAMRRLPDCSTGPGVSISGTQISRITLQPFTDNHGISIGNGRPL
ncbi:hypothetical protein OH491_27545 (plasmid) [Termitidicoccus mucosus]|uniref:hypothetical protein n=1 Tax=Termitidicoccus mucosus TaxID=1184151 RepID=UPI003183218D